MPPLIARILLSPRELRRTPEPKAKKRRVAFTFRGVM